MHNFDKTLLVAGAMLFLIGMLQGAVVDMFMNPRMALSAHLTAVQCGMAIMIAGAIWRAIALARFLQNVCRWTIIAGMFALWVGLTLSAATGASETLPMAGTGFATDAATEQLVTAIVLLSSVSMVIGWALLLAGLIRSPKD